MRSYQGHCGQEYQQRIGDNIDNLSMRQHITNIILYIRLY